MGRFIVTCDPLKLSEGYIWTSKKKDFHQLAKLCSQKKYIPVLQNNVCLETSLNFSFLIIPDDLFTQKL